MKNITVTLDEAVARWARVYAAERDTSVSRLLGELLKERMQRETRYSAASRRFTQRKPRQSRKSATPYPDRATLHDRQRFR